MSIGYKTTLWDFLKDHEIRIPIIQRDYAQGRKGKEELRRRFLKDLKETLSSNKTLTLDFAYGEVLVEKHGEKEDVKVFCPIDGQQRLTTLWLLHWYIAYKTGKLNNKEVKERLKKFSYATRVSARDFCKQLCELTPQSKWNETLVQHIENQNWFYSNWKQDPTIQSMLRMLSGELEDGSDGICGVFYECQDGTHIECKGIECFNDMFDIFWERLTNSDKPCIQFHVLDIADIGQTDDLYVKMNARGKPLSSFENFKADLVDYIHKQAINKLNNDWQGLDSPNHGFAQKLDNDWTNIFWKLRSSDESGISENQCHIDEIFFTFLNRYFFNCRAKELQNEEWNKHSLYGKDDTNLDFTTLEHYENSKKIIPKDDLINLEKVLDRLPILQQRLNDFDKAIRHSWETNNNETIFYFLPEYSKTNGELITQLDKSGNKILKVTEITIKQRAVFFAICSWLINNSPNNTKKYSDNQINAFKDWMRVIWNIVENSTNKGSNLSGALKLIDTLGQNSDNILMYLQSYIVPQNSFTEEQLLEECTKARLINGNNGEEWRDAITNIENNPLLRGKIKAILFTPNDNDELDVNAFKGRAKQFRTITNDKSENNIRSISAKLLRKADYTCWDNGNNWRFIVNRDSLDYFLHNPTDGFLLGMFSLLTNENPEELDVTNWRYYFIKYSNTFLNGTGYYNWQGDLGFRCRKINGQNLHSYHQNPYLAAAGYNVWNRDSNFTDTLDGNRTIEIKEEQNTVTVIIMENNATQRAIWDRQSDFVEWLNDIIRNAPNQ